MPKTVLMALLIPVAYVTAGVIAGVAAGNFWPADHTRGLLLALLAVYLIFRGVLAWRQQRR